MHSASILTFALLASVGLAAPAATASKAAGNNANGGAKAAASTSSSASKATAAAGANNGNSNAGKGAGNIDAASNGGVGQEDLTNAVNGWQADTGKVSNFLNKATSFSGDQFTNEAKIALDAETDELNHKAVIDATQELAANSDLKQANDTLATQGAFQAVVDALATMMKEGPDTAQQRVDEINQNRCVNVLPNIDMYMSVAGEPASSAIRPSACATINNDPKVNPSVIPDGVGAKGGSKADAATAAAPGATGASGNANGGGAAQASSSTTAAAARGSAAAGANGGGAAASTASRSSATAAAAGAKTTGNTAGGAKAGGAKAAGASATAKTATK